MTETIAITNWNEIVSPLYDASCFLLIMRPDKSNLMVNVRDMSIIEKAGACKYAGVNVLICGAISNIAHAALINYGIKVIPWIRGPVKEIIDAYGKHQNITEMFSMPGCNTGRCRGKQNRYRNRCCEENRSDVN